MGSRAVVTGGLILSAAFCFLIGLAGNYWALLFALIGLGAVAGSYHAPANTLLAQTFPRARLGGVLGLHTVGGNLSFFATPLLAGGLTALTLTWSTPYIAFAIAPLLAITVVPVCISRTNTSPMRFVSPATRFVAVLTKAM